MAAGGRAVPAVRVLAAALAISSALPGGGCAGLRPGEPGAVASPAAAAALADRLPPIAAGFRRGAARPAAGGREGREVAYATRGGRATAVATVELLADGTDAATALDALLAETLRTGPTREMREAGRFTLAGGAGAGASPLFCAETAGRYGRESVAGLVCAGRSGGALLRIRVTMPAREPPPAEPRAFAEAIAAALAGSTTVAAATAGRERA